MEELRHRDQHTQTTTTEQNTQVPGSKESGEKSLCGVPEVAGSAWTPCSRSEVARETRKGQECQGKSERSSLPQSPTQLQPGTWTIPQRAARTLDKGPLILGILGIFGQPTPELNFLSFLRAQEQGECLATAKEELPSVVHFSERSTYSPTSFRPF